MKKYNWPILKKEFLHGDWITLVSFFVSKAMKNNSYVRGKTAGWLQEKKEQFLAINRRVEDQFFKEEVRIRIRQLRIARDLQTKGLEAMRFKEIQTADEARKYIIEGIRIEKEALQFIAGHSL